MIFVVSCVTLIVHCSDEWHRKATEAYARCYWLVDYGQDFVGFARL